MSTTMVAIQARQQYIRARDRACDIIWGENQGLIANGLVGFYQGNLAEIWPNIMKTIWLYGNLKVILDSNLFNRKFTNY